MLVLPQMVEVGLTNNVKYYEDLGYEIPRRLNNQNRFSVPKGTKIMINVLDLSNGSEIYVDVLCDYCLEQGKKTIIKKKYYKYIKIQSGLIKKDCCDNCLGLKIRDSKRYYTIEDVKSIFNKEGYQLLSDKYINSHTSLDYICPRNHKYHISFASFLSGRRCKKCADEDRANKQRHPLKEVQEIFQEGNCKLLSKEYKNNHELLDYICECGKPNRISLLNFLQGQRCWECRNKKISINKKHEYIYVKEYFSDKNCILLSEEYLGADIPLDYICECGNPSKIRFSDFQRDHRCKLCGVEKISGVNHYNYNPDIPEEQRIADRNFEGYKEWRNEVYKRDNYTCQCCGDKKRKNIVAHHKDSYGWAYDKRIQVDNGITLCQQCHSFDKDSFHRIYGFGNNTKEQFTEWLLHKQQNALGEVNELTSLSIL